MFQRSLISVSVKKVCNIFILMSLVDIFYKRDKNVVLKNKRKVLLLRDESGVYFLEIPITNKWNILKIYYKCLFFNNDSLTKNKYINLLRKKRDL